MLLPFLILQTRPPWCDTIRTEILPAIEFCCFRNKIALCCARRLRLILFRIRASFLRLRSLRARFIRACSNGSGSKIDLPAHGDTRRFQPYARGVLEINGLSGVR